MEVIPNSPADLAGLRAFSDYIIGADSILHEAEDLFNLLENHEGVSLKLYVYNSDDDSCREVSITPNAQWGGEGSVGCGIGYGYLHRIPVRNPNANKPPPTTNIIPNIPSTVTPLITPTTVTVPNIPSTTFNAPSVPSTTEISSVAATLSEDVKSDVNNLIKSTSELTIQPSVPQTVPTTVIQDPIFSTPVTVATTASVQDAQPNSVLYTNIPPPTSIPQFYNVQQQNNVVQPVPMYPPQTGAYPIGTSNFAAYSYPQPMYTQVPVSFESQPPPLQNLSYAPAVAPPVSIPDNTVPQTPLIFDPTIAARSAQQLLSGNNPPS